MDILEGLEISAKHYNIEVIVRSGPDTTSGEFIKMLADISRGLGYHSEVGTALENLADDFRN